MAAVPVATPRGRPRPRRWGAEPYAAEVRIVTWNIELGRDVDGAITCLSDRPELAGADLLLLQEMDELGVARLAEALGLNHTYRPSVVHPKTGRPFGNAVLTPHEIVDVRPVALPHRARVSGVERLAVEATVATPSTLVRAVSVHTEIPLLSLRRRREQFRIVAEAARSGPGPVIVGGDFNTAGPRSRRALVSTMTGHGLEPLPDGTWATLSRFGRSFHLDHLFGHGVQAVAGGSSGPHPASDHAPVHAVVELRPETDGEDRRPVQAHHRIGRGSSRPGS